MWSPVDGFERPKVVEVVLSVDRESYNQFDVKFVLFLFKFIFIIEWNKKKNPFCGSFYFHFSVKRNNFFEIIRQANKIGQYKIFWNNVYRTFRKLN